MKHRRGHILIAAITLTAIACNCPLTQAFQAGDEPTETPTSTQLEEGTPEPEETEMDPVVTPSDTPTETPEPSATACSPYVEATMNVNVREGPDTVFDTVGALTTGQTAPALAKSTNGAWWKIVFGSGEAWVWDGGVIGECIPADFPIEAGPPTPTPPPTDTPTPTPTLLLLIPITIMPLIGDLHLEAMWMSMGDEIVLTVSNNPIGHFSGSFQYQVYADGSPVASGSCAVPTGSAACWTGYIVTGVETIRSEIDTNNNFVEINEGNNEITLTCSSAATSCN